MVILFYAARILRREAFLEGSLQIIHCKTCKSNNQNEVRDLKINALEQPEEKLWSMTKNMAEIKSIFHSINSLGFDDEPDYKFI